MRKIISLSIGVALAATVFAALPAAAGSATVTRGGDCGLPGLDVDGGLIRPGRMGTVKRFVVNDNHAKLTCKGTEIENDYGRTHVVAGFSVCGLPARRGRTPIVGITEDSFAKISKDGNAIVQCTLPMEQLERPSGGVACFDRRLGA